MMLRITGGIPKTDAIAAGEGAADAFLRPSMELVGEKGQNLEAFHLLKQERRLPAPSCTSLHPTPSAQTGAPPIAKPPPPKEKTHPKSNRFTPNLPACLTVRLAGIGGGPNQLP